MNGCMDYMCLCVRACVSYVTIAALVLALMTSDKKANSDHGVEERQGLSPP